MWTRAVVAAALLAACVACTEGARDTPASTATPASTSLSRPSTMVPAVTPKVPAPSSPASVAPRVERVRSATAFASPTRNILCYLDRQYASCRVVATDWDVPPRPASCDTDWGPDVDVGPSGAASFRCASDAVPYDWDGARRLAYAHTIRFGDVQCASSRDGMRCDDLRSGHGFTVSRSSYDLR